MISGRGWQFEVISPFQKCSPATHHRAMTRMGFTHMLNKYVGLAATSCPSVKEKHVTPHVTLLVKSQTCRKAI